MWIDTRTAQPVARKEQAIELKTLKEYHDWVNEYFDIKVLEGTDFMRNVYSTMDKYINEAS